MSLGTFVARRVPRLARFVANKFKLLRFEGGTVQLLTFDPAAGILGLELNLKGEEKPIILTMTGITTQDGKLQVGHFESNREWMTIVLNTYAAGKPFDLPEKYQDLLEVFKKSGSGTG